METKPNAQLITSLRFGAMLGLSLIILMIVAYVLDMGDSVIIKLLQWPIFASLLFLGIKELRDKHQGGFISYGKGLGTGMLISLFAGIIVCVYFFIFLRYIDPGFIQKMINQAEEVMVQQGLSDDVIQQRLEIQKQYFTPLTASLGSVLGTLIPGLILSLIISAVLKKKDPSFEANFR